MTAVEERLAELGLTVPAVAAPVADYVPALRTGAYVYTSGQLPFVNGRLDVTGRVGAGVSLEEAVSAARQCALNAIAAVASQVALDEVVRVVKVVVFVASDPSFTDQPKVADGASELIGQAFGEAGQHVRSAVGVAVLPLGSPVEVEIVVEVG
ncbi:LysR family transcriptional regulator [Aeromicrobium sp. PE09-221]|uniref:RidA family protein n=1 Tax=Aeromicrobium sp. PE09-221 TaxID=1898043 RepID=UPI000B3E746E|nr:RidA family protein [Aeromicrobium sp. PE09-221]OUZ10090.1 LysR family transcriptional regulator [Aeromicrobium sp. PE09-221]